MGNAPVRLKDASHPWALKVHGGGRGGVEWWDSSKGEAHAGQGGEMRASFSPSRLHPALAVGLPFCRVTLLPGSHCWPGN